MATATCVDCDWSDVESAAEIMAGNHRNFDSFAWQRPDGDHDFCIVYTSNRDSGLLDQSNAAAIEAELQPYLNAIRPNIFKQSHNHWAVGHVDGYAIRVYRKGKVTAVFRKWCELQARLADYPVLDEEAYGTLGIRSHARQYRIRGVKVRENRGQPMTGLLRSTRSSRRLTQGTSRTGMTKGALRKGNMFGKP